MWSESYICANSRCLFLGLVIQLLTIYLTIQFHYSSVVTGLSTCNTSALLSRLATAPFGLKMCSSWLGLGSAPLLLLNSRSADVLDF